MKPTQTQPPAAGEAAHTPGPFELNEPDRKGVIYIDAPDGTSVASVETRALRNAPEARANAAFIVHACNTHAQLTAENAEWSRQYKEAMTKRDELAVVADSLTAENAALREFAKQVVESMPTAEPWGPVDSSGWALNEQEARLWKAARALLSGQPAIDAALALAKGGQS